MPRSLRKGFAVAMLAVLATSIGCGDITTEDTDISCAPDGEYSGFEKNSPERAALFAIRAGGSAGFLDEGPTFRDYLDIEETEDGYSATFDPDLVVEVVLSEGLWRVNRVEGLIDEETCFTLLGYDEEDSDEPAEHQFLNVRLRAENKRAAIRAALIGSPVWMGPIPYEGFKSRCYAAVFNEEGEPTHRTRFYPIEIPEEESDRTSGNSFIEVPGDKESASGEFVCETTEVGNR